MRRTIIVIIIVGLLSVATLVIFIIRNNTPPGNTIVGGSLPTVPQQPPPTPIPIGDKITIGTSRGAVEISNPYKDAVRVEVGDYVLFRSSEDYHILYFPRDSSFLITILSNSFDAARQKAEAEFLRALGITQSQACLLNVSLTVPNDVNPNLSGKNLGLSFCPPAL